MVLQGISLHHTVVPCSVATPLDGTTLPNGFRSESPLITNVMCSGSESRLAECNSTYINTGPYSCVVAGVRCTEGEKNAIVTVYHNNYGWNCLGKFLVQEVLKMNMSSMY